MSAVMRVMPGSRSALLAVAAAAMLQSLIAQARAIPDERSRAEKIYAELGHLPATERTQRIEDGARREGKLVLVHTLRGAEGRGHVALFRKRYPFLAVDVAGDIGSQDAAERLLAEESAGRHITDVIITAAMDLAELLRKNDVARYPTPATDTILPPYRSFIDPENRWIPWFWSEHGISYNTDLVPKDKAPRDWDDLCNPFFKGSVSYDPAENRFLAGLNSMLGEEKARTLIECIGKNNPIIQRGHTQRMELMLAGDHMVQGDNYLYRGVALKRKNPSVPFAIVYSAPILATNDVAAINRNAPNPYAAALFADWLLSDESQAYLAKVLRGPVARKHPYLPDDVKLVNNVEPAPQVMQRLLGSWMKFVERKR